MGIYRSIQVLSIFLLVSAAAGCGTTATITRYGAPTIEAKITGGDQENVIVKLSGSNVPIPRNDIAEIDHPGNVAATIGAVVTAYGFANIAIGLPLCDEQGPAFCTGVFLPVGIGLPIMIYGLVVWGQSVNDSGPHSSVVAARKPSFAVVPAASFERSNRFVGASVAGSF